MNSVPKNIENFYFDITSLHCGGKSTTGERLKEMIEGDSMFQGFDVSIWKMSSGQCIDMDLYNILLPIETLEIEESVTQRTLETLLYGYDAIIKNVINKIIKYQKRKNGEGISTIIIGDRGPVDGPLRKHLLLSQYPQLAKVSCYEYYSDEAHYQDLTKSMMSRKHSFLLDTSPAVCIDRLSDREFTTGFDTWGAKTIKLEYELKMKFFEEGFGKEIGTLINVGGKNLNMVASHILEYIKGIVIYNGPRYWTGI